MKREVKTRVGGTRSFSSPGARDRARRLPVPKTQGTPGGLPDIQKAESDVRPPRKSGPSEDHNLRERVFSGHKKEYLCPYGLKMGRCLILGPHLGLRLKFTIDE